MTFFRRSWVIGRGVVTFSICSAMALASNTPTQIGSTRCPSLSRRMMIGMFVMGSTISPLIVISICTTHRLPAQTVRIGPGDPHRDDLPDPGRVAGQVHDRVAGRPARELPLAAPARRVDQDRLDPADGRLEQLPPNRLLTRLQRHDPARLLR